MCLAKTSSPKAGRWPLAGASTQCLNLSVTCSASSASNTITCKTLTVSVLN